MTSICEERYLEHLKLKREKPTLVFLTQIIKAHLARVPYENLSKLLRFKQVGASIPSFEEFVNQQYENNLGGTCFAQNIHLNRLLKNLEFNSQLVGIRRDGILSHVSLRVDLDGDNYLVDVGIMSPIAGPYRIHPEASFDTWIGNQQFIYKPAHDQKNYVLEIHRDGKMIRAFHSTLEPITDHDVAIGIQKTFEPGAMFMKTLCVHRVFSEYSIGLWNRQLYRIQGDARDIRKLVSFVDLKAALTENLKLPNYPLDEAIQLLQQNGAAPLFD